jgi:UDP-N-acetyl-D-mannosaminuronate dehydrogenase
MNEEMTVKEKMVEDDILIILTSHMMYDPKYENMSIKDFRSKVIEFTQQVLDNKEDSIKDAIQKVLNS